MERDGLISWSANYGRFTSSISGPIRCCPIISLSNGCIDSRDSPKRPTGTTKYKWLINNQFYLFRCCCVERQFVKTSIRWLKASPSSILYSHSRLCFFFCFFYTNFACLIRRQLLIDSQPKIEWLPDNQSTQYFDRYCTLNTNSVIIFFWHHH